MSAEVETMFSVKETPWHGIGKVVDSVSSVEEALVLAGIPWKVMQSDIVPYVQLMQIIDDIKFAMTMGQDVTQYTHKLEEIKIPGYKLNYRETDFAPLGIVTDHYRIVQNVEALTFANYIFNEGATFETAGALRGGKQIFVTMKLSTKVIVGEETTLYLVLTNSHDGKGAVTVMITPVRVVCQNTLNLALRNAVRKFTCAHRGSIESKLAEARYVLTTANEYMTCLEEEFGELKRIKLTDEKVKEYTEILLPSDENDSVRKANWIAEARKAIYDEWNAPDLADREKSAFRYVNAISAFATHYQPMRMTKNFKENRMIKTVDGNPYIDKAYELVLAGR